MSTCHDRADRARRGVDVDAMHIMERSLAACDGAVCGHLDAVVRRFGSAALGVVDLPPLRGGAVDAEQVRIVSVLWWTREIEECGLPEFVERLAAGIVNGQLLLPLRGSVAPLVHYHHERDHRFSRDERLAIYERIFGDGGGVSFEQAFDSLVAAIAELGRTPVQVPLTHLQVQISTLGQELASELSSRGVGVAAFAARDIVANVRRALALLGLREIKDALGAHPPLELIRMHAPMVLGREVDPIHHAAKAEAGRKIIAWLATRGPALARHDEIVAAATRLQSLGAPRSSGPVLRPVTRPS